MFKLIDKKHLWIILILFLGLFLRTYGLGDESLWIDEAATRFTTQQTAQEVVSDIYTTTTAAPDFFEHGGNPPFYYLAANFWTGIIGISEAKLRFLSVIFGVASIYLIFLIGKMIFDYKVGLVSAFILSINYLHILYSQEARSYSLVILLTLLTIYFLLNALKKEKMSYWIFYTLTGALLIYTHYFGVFALIFEYLFMLVFYWRKFFKQIIFSGIGVTFLYLPWIPALLRQFADRGYLVDYLGQNLFYDLVRIFVQFNSWLSPDLETRIALRSIYHSIGDFSFSIISNVPLLGWLVIISILLLTSLMGLSFLISIFYKDGKISASSLKDKRYSFLLLWFLVPIFLPFTLAIFLPSSPVFGFVQYTIFAAPAYYILASKGILKLKKYKIVLALLVILSIMPLFSYYSNFDKQQWREAAQYLVENREKDELVIVNKANHILPLGYYYDQFESVEGIKNIEEFIPKISGRDRFIFIYTSERYGDPGGTLKKYLDENYKVSKKVEFTGIKIFHYSER